MFAEALIEEEDPEATILTVSEKVDRVTLSRAENAQEAAQNASPMAVHGTNQHKNEGGVINTSKPQRGSTNADYLASRLKRDRPDIAEKVARGEYKSMRAAAMEAGIVKAPDIVKVRMSA